MSDHVPGLAARRARKKQSIVGVRELKTHAAHILRQVRDSRTSYLVTHRGKTVGVLLPIDEAEGSPDAHENTDGVAAWDTFLRAGRRLERRFSRGMSGVDLLSGSRR
jgi:prevent-host-death family protein